MNVGVPVMDGEPCADGTGSTSRCMDAIGLRWDLRSTWNIEK